MSEAKIRVEFRMEPKLYTLLATRARVANKSPGLFAGELVAKALTEEKTVIQVAALVQAQNQNLLELRKDLRMAVETILNVLGSTDKMTPEKAREWAQENLFSP